MDNILTKDDLDLNDVVSQEHIFSTVRYKTIKKKVVYYTEINPDLPIDIGTPCT